MRFMIMHKNDPNTEAGKPPPMELVHKMGAFIGEYAQTGRFIDGAGLDASKTRTRLVFRNGQCTTKRGPYRGEHELPAATLLLKVRTREEAIGWAERYGKILGDGELEVGKVNEPWDIGIDAGARESAAADAADREGRPGHRGRRPQPAAEGRALSPQDRDDQGRRARPRAPTAAERQGQAPHVHEQRAARDRRPVRRVEGADRRLRGHGAVRDGRSDRAVPAYAEILGGTLEIDVRLVDEGDEAA